MPHLCGGGRNTGASIEQVRTVRTSLVLLLKSLDALFQPCHAPGS